MMKRYIFLGIIILLVILSVFGVKVYRDNATITIQAHTPNIVYNEMGISGADEGLLLLPIKSIKVLKSSTPVDITFKKIDSSNKDNNLFEYKDLSKYSVITYDYKSDHLDRTYGYMATMEYNATFEITFYKNEVKNVTKLKNLTSLMANANDTLYMLVDAYNGGIRYAKTTNTQVQTDLNALYQAKYLAVGSNYDSMLNDLATKPEFLKAANEIESMMKSDSVYDKCYAIYSWITSHIDYDEEATKNNTISSADLNTKKDNPSAYRALVTGKTTCTGYAHLFDALSRYYSIPTYVFTGKGAGGVDHFWNAVIDSNKVLLIDCTYGAEGNSKSYFVYAPDESFASNHLVWNNERNNFFPMREVNIQ